MILEVKVDETDYGRVIQSLRILDKSEESILKTAVNNTARQTRELLAKKIAARYAGKAARKSEALKSSRIEKATISSTEAVVIFSSPIHEVKDFHVTSLKVRSPYTGKGRYSTFRPRGNVLKGSSKKFDEGFVVRFRSGHVAVVSRVPGENMKKYAGKPKKPHYEKLRVWYSPSKASMAKNVYDADEISKRLHEEINKMLDKVLKGG